MSSANTTLTRRKTKRRRAVVLRVGLVIRLMVVVEAVVELIRVKLTRMKKVVKRLQSVSKEVCRTDLHRMHAYLKWKPRPIVQTPL